MSTRLQPSLKRRLIFTLLGGMLFIWGMLLVKDYLGYRHKIRHELTQGELNRSLLMSLERLPAQQAETAISHTHVTFELLNAHSAAAAKGPVYFQWRHRPTGRLYVSHPAVALPPSPPPNGQVTLIEQRAYWPVTHTSAHWQLTLWHPAMDDSAALTAIALDLLSYMVWAFPVLVLLLMLAIWQGFKPLKRLSDEVRHRSPDDFTALTDPTGYAELAPILTAFNDLLGRVRQQRAHEKQFYETVAHELKTPLAVIAGHAHAVALNTDQATKLQSLRVLERTIETVSTQINQLICLSSLSTSPASQPPCTLDMVALLQDMLIDFMPLAQSRNMELTLDAPDQLTLHGRESAVELVIKNLLKNAITHGAEGGRVEVKLSQTGPNWTLVVADSGPGLTAQQVAGGRYRPGAPHGEKQLGSGLGLAIVAQAVEVLRGTLTLGPGLEGKGLSAFVVAPMSVSS
ncbi:MAG: ATP-binding protein [Aquabacterium sp.]